MECKDFRLLINDYIDGKIENEKTLEKLVNHTKLVNNTKQSPVEFEYYFRSSGSGLEKILGKSQIHGHSILALGCHEKEDAYIVEAAAEIVVNLTLIKKHEDQRVTEDGVQFVVSKQAYRHREQKNAPELRAVEPGGRKQMPKREADERRAHGGQNFGKSFEDLLCGRRQRQAVQSHAAG